MLGTWDGNYQGSAVFKLVSKLKALKLALKKWSNSENTSTKKNIQVLSEQLTQLQQKLELDLLTVNCIKKNLK